MGNAMTIWVLVGIALLGALVVLVVTEGQDADHHRRVGSGRQARRHPGEGYVPRPVGGGRPTGGPRVAGRTPPDPRLEHPGVAS